MSRPSLGYCGPPCCIPPVGARGGGGCDASQRAGSAASWQLHPCPGLLQTGSGSQGRILSRVEAGQSRLPAHLETGEGCLRHPSPCSPQGSLALAGRDATQGATNLLPPPSSSSSSFLPPGCSQVFNICPRFNPSLPSRLQLPDLSRVGWDRGGSCRRLKIFPRPCQDGVFLQRVPLKPLI